MRYNHFHDNLAAPVKLGIGLGTIALLGRWLTGLNIVDSPEALMRYGLYGTLGYSLATALALMLFGWLGKYVRSHSGDAITLSQWLTAKLTPSGARLMTGLFAILLLETVLLQGMVSGFFFHQLFDLPEVAGRTAFIVTCSLLAGFIGLQTLYALAIPQAILTFSVAIMFPLFYFIRQGVDPVYSGIRLYHPYMLVIDNHSALLFIATGVLVGLGQVIADPATWQRLFHIERSKIVPAFMMSGMMYATVLMAFLLLVMVSIHSGGLANIPSLIYPLLSITHSPILFGMLIICLILMFTVSYMSRFQAVLRLCIEQFSLANSGEKRTRNIIICMAMFIATIISLSVSMTPIQILYLFGSLHGCMLGPMLLLTLIHKRTHGIALPLITLGGWFAQFLLQLFSSFSGLERIWISSTVSAVLTCIYLLVTLGLRRHTPHTSMDSDR